MNADEAQTPKPNNASDDSEEQIKLESLVEDTNVESEEQLTAESQANLSADPENLAAESQNKSSFKTMRGLASKFGVKIRGE